MSNGCRRNVSHAGPRIGIAARVKFGIPIETVTLVAPFVTSGCSTRCRAPARVRTSSSASVDEASIAEQCPDTPDAVAAHLGLGAVRVHVVHEERRAGVAAADDPDDAVGADAATTIAQRGRELGRDRAFVVEIDDHDEVVAGSVVLRERQLAVHAPSR